MDLRILIYHVIRCLLSCDRDRVVNRNQSSYRRMLAFRVLGDRLFGGTVSMNDLRGNFTKNAVHARAPFIIQIFDHLSGNKMH